MYYIYYNYKMLKKILLLAMCVLGTFTGTTAITNLRGTTDYELSSPMTKNDMQAQFETFQVKYKKKYSDSEEIKYRFEVFRSNLKDIVEHNMNSNDTFVKGINQFTDLTANEFKKFVIGFVPFKQSEDRSLFGATNCKPFSGTGASPLPDSVDWRTKNAVSSVKDQGQCGSCWSFSASGAMEGAWAISHNELYNLSEQELVDCAGFVKYGSMGCNGGQMDGAFKFAMDNGMCSDSSYPYTSGSTKSTESCKKCTPVVNISGCYDVTPNNQLALKAAVAKGPVSVAIEADTRYFQSYSSGILTSSSCGTDLDHGVLIVGYGSDNGQAYWIVKNSWSSSWGEDGYVRIARHDSSSDAGICGIAMQPSFPEAA